MTKKEGIKLTGKIKFYDAIKGYGFIKMEDDKPDYFFHLTNLSPERWRPEANDKVSFTADQNEKGLFAADVTKIDE